MAEYDERAAEEEQAAAEEAAAIGGPNPEPDMTDAERVISEGGGGESEGFELAEEDLQRNASHDDGHGNPMLDEIDEEGEEPASAEYGEADHERYEEKEQ